MKDIIKFLLGAVVLGAMLAFLLYVVTGKAEAKEHKQWLCHCEPQKECVSIFIDEHAVQFHLREHENDYLGKCREPVFHNECVEEACVLVEGEGEDACKVDKDCEVCEEPVDKPNDYEAPRNTFHPDTRCLDTRPPAITWVTIEDGSALNNWFPQATWSAMGGDTIEVCFSEDVEDPRWCFEMENDGHQEFGHVAVDNTGILGMIQYYGIMRTVNGCKEGPWTNISWFN